MRLTGTVVGTATRAFRPDDARDWAKALEDLSGQRVIVTIEPQPTKRTEAQNDYWWGPVLDVATAYVNATDNLLFPVHKTTVHLRLKEAILGLDERGNVVGSRHLSTKEFSQLVDETRAFLATRGYYVPDPGEAEP